MSRWIFGDKVGSSMDSSLYIVPTPIGNLADITLRALDILKNVDVILAEDTRKTGFLLAHYQIQNNLKQFHNYNEHQVVMSWVDQMAKGAKIALVSDAGTPGISDPGFLIVREVLRANLKLECLPGANAFVPALIKSGFPTDRFVFEGFLPHKKGKQKWIQSLAEEERTMIFYESPYRLLKTIEQFARCFGEERKASVSRELTKIYEETINGSLRVLMEHFTIHEPKGEFVIVVSGKSYSESIEIKS